jgi:hypothetical protein
VPAIANTHSNIYTHLLTKNAWKKKKDSRHLFINYFSGIKQKKNENKKKAYRHLWGQERELVPVPVPEPFAR